MKVTQKDMRELYGLFEDVASAIDACRLRKEHRRLVGSRISEFRRAVIGLGERKDKSTGKEK